MPMPWKVRSLALRMMATLPGGYGLYQLLQRYYGLHCHPSFIRMKLKTQRDLARLILESGNVIAATKMVEVGTGWIPLAPIGFWICGAGEVHTYDINRHLIPSGFRKALLWMANNEAELIALWDGLVPSDRVRKCLRTIRQLCAEPLELLKA